MFYFDRCLSNRRNQAINLHLLDMIHHVIAVTTDFKDNCLIHNCTVTDQYNVKHLLPPVLLMLRQRQVLAAVVFKSRQVSESWNCKL